MFFKRGRKAERKKRRIEKTNTVTKKNGYSTFAIGRANSTESKKKRKGTKEENKIE